ncbi:MAG: T9SS type A sorting domain-containing protein [Bacteroidota bacterium]
MKKHNYLFILLLFITNTSLLAQSLDFAIANKTVTATEVTFDVTLASDTPFKLGSGQLYFNFNTAAFGEWVIDNDAVTISYPDGSVLAQSNGFPLYTSFVENDNTASRFSFSWQQGVSSGTYPADNITSTPAVLFHVSMAFTTGGQFQSDDICFESSDVFDDQTFTACGPASFGFADCLNEPGVQLTDDNFECSAALPIQLLNFEAQAQDNYTTLLNWQTASEYNNEYFTVERSVDGRTFLPLEKVPGAGFSNAELSYQTIDPNPYIGINYYRLKQTDFDGAFSYSEIQSVQFAEDAWTKVTVYPNPSPGLATLSLNTDFKLGTMQILNTDQQLLFTQELTPDNRQVPLELTRWPAGVYFISVQLDGERTTQRLVITD